MAEKNIANSSGETANQFNLITLADAGERFGVCSATIKRWAKRGLLNIVRINSRVLRVAECDVARLQLQLT